MADLLHVLIIEDSENDAELIRHYLQKDGFELVFERVDTLAGIKSALQKPGWDVILSDFNLPGFNAYAALTAVQETGEDIPFLVVSGMVEEETAVELMRLGAADYLMKDKLDRLGPAIWRELQDARIRRERRETRDALIESNRRFRILFDQSPFGVVIIDPRTSLPVEFNNKAFEQLGYTRNEFALLRIAEYDINEDEEDTARHIAACLKKGGDDFETLHRTKQGAVRLMRITSQPINLGGREYLHCIYQDITEQKQAETSLRESEATLSDIFQTVNDGIAYTSLTGEVLSVNNALLDILKIPREKLEGRNILSISKDLLTAKNLKVVIPVLKNLLKGEQIKPFEFEYQDKIIEITTIINKTTGRITAVIRDITERKQAENILRENEQRFRMMYESSPLGYQSLDIEGRFIDVNPAWVNMLGYSRDEVVGNWFGDFLIPEQQVLFMQRFPCFVKDGEIRNIEFEMLHKDGRILTIGFDGLIGHTTTGKFRQTHCVLKDVTESKKAAQVIKTHLELLNSMVTNISDVIAVMTIDGTLTYKSPNITKWFGWNTDDLVGTDSWETVHPEDLQRVQAAFANLIKEDGRTDTIEYRYKCKDGSYKLIKLTAVNLTNDPVIQGVLMNYHDVTAQREAEARQRATEEKFKTAFETSPDAISISRVSDGKFIEINNRFLTTSGYTKEEVIGKSAVDLNLWVNPEKRVQAMEDMRKNATVPNTETEIRMKNGDTLAVLMSASLVEIEGEACILTITRDISEQKKATEAIHLQSTALNAAANAISITDSDNRLTWVNQAFTELTGYSWQECMGRKLEELVRSGEYDDEFYEEINRTITSGHVWHGEIINRRKNGEHYTEEMTVTPVTGEDGQITSFISIKQDVTERKKFAEVLAARLHLLEYANEHPLEDVLQETLTEAEKLTESLVGFYHFINEDQQTISLQAWSKLTLESCAVDLMDTHYPINLAGVWTDCIQQRKAVIQNEYAALPHRKGMPAGHAPVIRELVVPVFRGEQIVAVLGVGNKQSDYREADVEQITRLADLAWDIAEKKISELARQESEARYRDLFENSPVPTWVEDFSEVHALFEQIRASGVTDMRAYFEKNLDAVKQCTELIKVVDVNRASLDFFGFEDKSELVTKLSYYFNEKSLPVFREEIIALAEGASHFRCEIPVNNLKREETILSANLTVDPAHTRDLSRVLFSFMDITEQRMAEERNRAERELLKVCNYAQSDRNLLHDMLGFFKEYTGCEAVGIRLHHNGDFPYFETSGFPESFVKMENSLCAVDAQGQIIRDEIGNPVLECMCGNVLCNRFDPQKPFFTQKGSFWSGNTSALLASTTEEDRQARTRNRCNGEGYESVALIPIQVKGKSIGLLQLNDSRVGVHTAEKISELEHLVDYMAIALAKQESDTALAESENRFKYFFQHSVHGKSITQISGEVQANQAFCEMLGYTPDEFARKTWQEMTHPDDIDFNQKLIDGLLRGESSSIRFTKRFIHKDGSIVWADVGSTLRRDLDGKPLYLLTSISDISDIKRAEEKLRASEERFRSYVENASDILYSLDEKGTFTYISPLVFDQLGYVPEELTGQTFEAIIHPEDIPACREFLHKVVSGSTKQSGLEFRIKHHNGDLIWYTTNASPITDENDKNFSYLGIAYDINQRKAAEAALLVEKQKAQNYLDIADVMLVAFGVDEKISLMNRRGCQILGYTEDELLGKNWFDTCLPVRLRQDIKQVFEGVKTGQIKTFEYYENPVLTRSGEERMIGWHNAPILDEEGNVTGVISSGEDITERKMAEAALRDSEKRYRLVVEANIIGVVFSNPETGLINDANDEYLRIIGRTREDMQAGRINWKNLTPPEYIPYEEQIFTQAPFGGIVKPYEKEYLRPDGSRIPVIIGGTYISDNKDMVVAFVLDNTVRKQAENDLLDSQAMLAKSQEIAHVGSWELDTRSGRLSWTDEVYRIFGVEKKDFPGTLDAFMACVHPDERESVNSRYFASMGESGPYEIEHRIIQQNSGTVLLVVEKGYHVRGENGEVVKSVGMVQDITERKKAEQTIRESEERIRLIFETLAEGVALNEMVFNDAGEMIDYRVLEVNRAFYDIANYPEGTSVIGKLATEIYNMDEKYIKEFWKNHKDSKETVYTELVSPISQKILGIWTSPFVDNRFVTSFVDITERKQAEQKLRESEALLNETQRVSKLGGWEWNIATQTMTWSDEVYRIHGISPSELPNNSMELDQRSRRCYPPDDRKKINALFEECLRTGQPYALEARFIAETGEEKWVSTSGEGHLENGKVIRVSGNVMDITKRKQAEIELHESEERYHVLVEASPSAIFILQDGKYTFANSAGLSILGFESEMDVVGMDIVKTIHPDSFQVIKERMANINRGLPNRATEMKIVRKNGEVIFTESISTPIKINHQDAILVLTNDITERKAAAQELARNELKLSSIIQGTHVGTWEENPQTGEVMVDANAAAIIGYTPDEVMNLTLEKWLEHKHPQDRQASQVQFEKHLRGETDFYSYETRMKHKDGHWVWVLSQGKVTQWDNAGKPLWVLGTHLDITGIKQSEALVRKSEALLNQSQHLSKMGGWEWDAATDNMIWSDEVYNIHGFTCEDSILSTELKQRSLECYPPQDRELIRDAFEACAAAGTPYELEVRFISKNGEHKWVRTMGNPVMEDGQVVRVTGNIMDITERKMVEEELQNREALLAESQRIAHLGSYILDFELNTNFWSPETYRIFGLDESEPVPTMESYMSLVHPEDHDPLNNMIELSILSGKKFDLVYRIFRPGNEMRYVHSIGNTELNEAGKVVKMIGTIQDVTESKLLENEVLESLQEKEVLLREIHHRVKNNLASILGLLEMERQAASDEKADSMLMELGNRIKSMSTIHEKLYRSPNLSQIDFDDYLKSFTSHLRTSIKPAYDLNTIIKARGVDLSLDLAVPCGLIINELVTNVMKYAFPEGKPGVPGDEVCEIRISMTVKDTAYTLTVADNGVGMPENMNWRDSKTLGLRLITMLGEHQLGGKIRLDRSRGTKFVLKFDPRHRK